MKEAYVSNDDLFNADAVRTNLSPDPFWLQPSALIKQSPGHKRSYLVFPAAAASCPASD